MFLSGFKELPSTQKQTVPGGTTCWASIGTEKYTSYPHVLTEKEQGNILIYLEPAVLIILLFY